MLLLLYSCFDLHNSKPNQNNNKTDRENLWPEPGRFDKREPGAGEEHLRCQPGGGGGGPIADDGQRRRRPASAPLRIGQRQRQLGT